MWAQSWPHCSEAFNNEQSIENQSLQQPKRGVWVTSLTLPHSEGRCCLWLTGVGGITLAALLLSSSSCLLYWFLFSVMNTASIFGGLLLRPPPGHPPPDITEKSKAQQFIHQFLLREDNLPWISDAANLIFRYQITVKILVLYSILAFFFYTYHNILYNLWLLKAQSRELESAVTV